MRQGVRARAAAISQEDHFIGLPQEVQEAKV
jgi:hypothetical protein